MLIHLQIRDLAIVEHLELELAPGMTAITGETGAGKSIMVDALSLLLGDRADSSVIRFGAQRAEISAVFDLYALPGVRAWLAERDLDLDRDCHLRRIISRDGRSRAYINGTPQPVQALKDLGDLLVDIHGQHEHQSLLKRDLQRQLLDDCAGHQDLVTELAGHFQTWNRLRQQFETLNQARTQRDSRLDLLRYQIRELEVLNLQEGELATLGEEHLRLANADRLLETCQHALNQLYESDELSIYGLLGRTLHDLEALCPIDNRLGATSELLNAALIQVQEASDELRRYLQHIDAEPGRLEWVEQRLGDIHNLARKYRLAAEELPSLLGRLQDELIELEHSELHHEQLERELEQISQSYFHCAESLSARRQAAAEVLGKRIGTAMSELGMPGGQFGIALKQGNKPAPHGLETVEFLVSANPGQPLKPLTKVASGGELSRISLAVQVITAHSARIPVLIFDEVDTGIGGGIAEVVGRQLHTLGETRQVLCVTHLPQVAAQAHRQLKVSKRTDADSTSATVTPLTQEQRIQEIARMLGGLELTDNAFAHAREMIERAQKGKAA